MPSWAPAACGDIPRVDDACRDKGWPWEGEDPRLSGLVALLVPRLNGVVAPGAELGLPGV